AVALNKAKKFKEAFESAHDALNKEPANPYSILAAGDALYGLKRYEEAYSYYREIFNNERVGLRACKGALECLRIKRDWERILSIITEVSLPENERLLYKAAALGGLGEKGQAMEIYREVLKENPDEPRALWELTELEIEAQGIEPVKEKMRRLAKIPSRPPIYGKIYASLCRRTGETEKALSQYGKIEEKQSDPWIIKQKAFTLAKAGSQKEAIPLLEELLRLDPGEFYVRSAYEAACKKTGEVERAINFYQELLGLYPDTKWVYGRIRRLKKSLPAEPNIGEEQNES
ncbi:MAG: hypothetical protein DRP87_18075, partial [Spirochaetes bacterium]